MMHLKKAARRAVCALLTAAMLCSDAGLTAYAVEAAEQGALAETTDETAIEDVQLGEDAVEGDKIETPSQEGGQTQEQQTEETDAGDLQEKSPSIGEEQPGENSAGDGNTETPPVGDSDIEEEDNTAAAAEEQGVEEEEESFESEIVKEMASRPEMKTVERKLTGVYQFGGAPSKEDIAAVRGTSSYFARSADSDDTVEMEEFIYQQMLERKTEIDLGDYGVALDADEADRIVEAVLNEHPDLYFVDSEIGYSGIDSGDDFVVTTISPNYYTDMENAAFAAAVADALKTVKSDMSDLEKAIVLHDYLAVNCEYDKINFDKGYVPPDSHSAYGALVNRTAVCDGYALAYKHLLNQVHIQCYMVESNTMNHAWNLIELGGSYYQVDVTWDDPVWDLIGRARHEYMFRSDNAFQSQCGEKHYDWYVTKGSEVVDCHATDTRYDNAFWVNCDSPLVMAGGNCYFTAYDTQNKKCAIQKRALSDLTGSGEVVCSFDRWTLWGGGGGWPGVFSGLFTINDRLYYNDKTSIYSISLNNTENGLDRRTAFKADTTNGYIYGSAYCQGKVLYSLHQTPNLKEKETVLTADLTVEPEDKIALDKSAVTLKIGETVQLTVTAAPDNVTEEEVAWESSQNSVATVENGIVTAIAAGKCTITASAGGKTAVCAVTVTDGTQADIIASGENKKNGSDTKWTIDADGKLTLEGRGEFERTYVIGGNQQQGWCLPWSDYEHEIKTAEVNVTGMKDASCLFKECDNLVSVDVSGFDTSQVTNMSGMFVGCKSLLTLDLSSFKTNNVTDMSDMFSRCSALTTLNLGNFDTAQVTSMQCMFWSCKSLTHLDLSSFDASQVVAAGSGISIGASGGYTGGMCLGCDKLQTIHTPYNLKVPSELPEGVWYQPDGTERTELPQNLDHSILIKKGEIPTVSFIEAKKTKTDYVCGDVLNLDDIMVTYCDADGAVHKLGNRDYTTNADEIDMSTAGKKNLTITYNNGEIVFTYEVELTVTAKEIENPSDKITLNKDNTAITFRDTSDCIYDGTPKTPEVTVVYTADGQSVTLEKEKDYTVTYENNVNVFEDTAALETAQDAPRVVITGCGRCSGTISRAFLIRKALLQEVAAPAANPESERQLSAGSKVMLVCETAGAEIYYTTGASEKDLADPIEKGVLYTEPITVDGELYIRAAAVKGTNRSRVVTFHYTVLDAVDKVMQPYADPGQGIVEGGTKITLKCDTPDAAIYYMTGANADLMGAVPMDEAHRYAQPIEITKDTAVKAVARKEGMKDSDAALFEYKVKTVLNVPVADPESGTVDVGSYISLKADSDVKIYYTTDQSDPAASGTAKLYEGKIRVDGEAGSVFVIKAAAEKKGIYSETVTYTYTISEKRVKGLQVMLAGSEEFTYTGSAITPAVIVTNNGEVLTEGKDYTVRYSNNVKAADRNASKAPKITVTGKGNLTKSRTVTFTIVPKDIGDKGEVVGGTIVVASGETASPVLFYGGVKLTTKDFVNPSAKKKYETDGTITLTGKGNFKGTRDMDVRVVNKEDRKKFNVVIDNTALKNKPLVYDGEEKTLDGYFEVYDTKDKSKASPLEEYRDYTVIYSPNPINAGKVKFTVVGLGEYCGTVTKSYTIKPRAVKVAEDGNMKVNVEDGDSYPFKNGGVTIPNLAVTCDGKVLIPGKDYKVVYSGNKKICKDNKAKCTISFKGNYKGSKALVRKFNITPAVLADVEQINGSVSVAVGDKIYTGRRGAYKSIPYVTVDGILLKSSDYKVSYYKDEDREQEIDGKTASSSVELKDKNKQTVYVKIEGKKNYEGTLNAEYNVYKLNEEGIDIAKTKVKIVGGTKKEYTGEGIEPDIEISYKSGKEWIKVEENDIGTYVKVTYINNVNKGKATVMVNGDGGKYVGSKTAAFNIVPKDMR